MTLLAHLVFLLLLVLAAADQAVDDTYGDDGGTYYNQFSVCEDSIVVVEEMSIVCDSPGAYYYGSNKYRNSATCQAGDKAKYELLLYVSQDLSSSGVDPYVDMSVRAYGTVETETLSSGASMCSISNLKALDGQTCPEAGYYKIQDKFYWGSQSDSYDYSFKPRIVVGIASSQNPDEYDLGGANTGKCPGETVTSWTTGVAKSAANTVKTFFMTFGILLACLVALGLAGYFIIRKANGKHKSFVRKQSESLMDEKENEIQKVAMIGKNRNLVDF